MDAAKTLQRARDVLAIEARGILSLNDCLDESLVGTVDLAYHCKANVVVTGLGKPGLICRKIAATLSSTGTPSLFLHAGDANHGDMGMINKGDVVLAISNSGETEEILKFIPTVKRLGVKLIAMTGNAGSNLSRAADVALNAGVQEEACPLGLSPTASTTPALALGDALAVVLLEKKGFKQEDFAMRHPGGSLGRRLLLRVEELMHQGAALPIVGAETPMKEAILEITSKRLGVTGVVDGQGRLAGVITDGDLRRGLESKGDIFRFKAKELMSRSPKTIASDDLAAAAVAVMGEHSINSLFVVDAETKKPVGVLHLHDLLKAGV